jgi:eukaryotic-like serine/threonine-protein kinase
VTDETVPQFGRSLRTETQLAATADAGQATACPVCGAHFSRDARFCPFDGSSLVSAPGWTPGAGALLGTVVDGRYEVLSIIGEGGMGVVYEVRHRALGKRFALKALRDDLARDAELAARFIQEARTAAAVSHPGLVEITDFGRLPSGQVYFVMELLEGQSLAKLLRSAGRLPVARSLAIVRQLARALKAAHDAGIVHRDLKPDNIHIGRADSESERVKIVDFGLAKVIGASGFTRAGMVFGTPHYMSPEQAAGEVVDHRADIYALGIVMYEMFTGKVPFEADSFMGVLTKHLYMVPTPPSARAAELKALGPLEDVILRALQKRPEARYDNLAQLLTELDQTVPRQVGAARARSDPNSSLFAHPLELPPTRRHEPARGFDAWRLLALVLSGVAVAALVVALGGRSTRLAPAVPSAFARSPQPLGQGGGGQPVTTSMSTTDPAASAAQPNNVPARKPTPPALAPLPRKTAPSVPKVTASTKKPRLDSGEIVDPWAH